MGRKRGCQIGRFVGRCRFSRAVTRWNLSETKPVERIIDMLKQNLTKVIAVATIAAAGVFVAGCGAEEIVEDGSPNISEDGKENENPPDEDPDPSDDADK